MAWERRMPFGYCMEQGTLRCEQTEAETVKQVFSLYLTGHSLKRIAETMTEQGVAYHKDKPCWNKDMVNRILENRKYLGDGEYPRIIREEDFHAVQRLKKDKNRYAPCPTQIVPIKEKLVCGVCGARMMRLSLGKGVIRWKCRNPDCQCAVRFADSEFCRRVDNCFRELAKTPELLVHGSMPATLVRSDVLRLENELVAAFNRGVESAEYVKTLIFAVAAEKYRQLPDYTYRHKVEALCAKVATEGVTERLKQELMDTAVRAIRIGAGSTITLQLINGQTVSVEEETK